MTRPDFVAPPEPKDPYPVVETGCIIAGFGRGSSELGIPTANVPVTQSLDKLPQGVYYGFSRLITSSSNGDNDGDDEKSKFNYGVNLTDDEKKVLPMVMSIGWNPFYKNEQKAAEIHIINKFTDSFYGAQIKFVVLGYIRPELDYTTVEALIADINIDIEQALQTLHLPEYNKYQRLVE
ncbi:riboflavin kinase [Scheffersomyces spartinae]|uniref:Riboflavin kinase n=1 Tax=Scheffersomyces spartinae TaxID=45513 RepID=A0A9P8AHI5_9ASCO|nr:riboflavin kinase [Scheffersomyces spartinae]KAG7192733.1 riboflavin kinase [Scheffersomyces spartinae]